MDFNARKQLVMASLGSQEADRSRKGGVDAPIAHLINSINSHPSYYTTSSCSGRISVLQDKGSNPAKKKAGEWIFVSHEPADPEQIVKLLFDEHLHNNQEDGLVVFRFEPFILALDCRDVPAAQSLVSSAISCGFRESGITSIGKRIMVALRCSIRLEVPIADRGKMMVSTDYVRFLVNLANYKMEANKKRTDKFLRIFQEQGQIQRMLLTSCSFVDGLMLSADGGNFKSMTKHSCQLQGNVRNCLQGTQGAETKRLDGNHGSQVQLMEQSSISELEHRQHKILSQITSLEEKMLINCNIGCGHGKPVANYIANYCEELGSFSNLFSIKDGEQDGTGSASSNQHPNYASGLSECRSKTSTCQYQHSGNSEASRTCSGCTLMAIKMKIVSEPLEKLFRWGHSTCVADFVSCNSLLIFGGYGGPGWHCRQNDTLILDAGSGSLKILNTRGPPSPRMGHTASMVNQYMFIIGGREEPTRILSDVWVLHMAEMKWHSLEFNGSLFPARHRHAAAVVGPNIYVFGGVNDATIYGDMYVLDTNVLQWKEVHAKGELPCARHSHSLAATRTKIYLFGGYDGDRILGDLYVFDVETQFWKEEETFGRVPGPKFSHSMFVFNKYLAVLGGCPVTQQFQELALLDLEHQVWKYVTIPSISDCLLVRSTVNVVGNDLIIIGGGASCYAFGTKFNEPLKLCLGSLTFSKQDVCFDIKEEIAAKEQESSDCYCTGIGDTRIPRASSLHPISENLKAISENNKKGNENGSLDGSGGWVLKLDKLSAKLGKDTLKKLGWLDLRRKARVVDQASHICFPITEEAACFFYKHKHGLVAKMEYDSSMDFDKTSMVRLGKGISKNKVSCPELLAVLISCGGSIIQGEICSSSKEFKSPQEALQAAVSMLAKQKGLPHSILEELPSRWERLGDMAILPMNSFKDNSWHSFGNELWATVARALGVRRLARQGRIAQTGTRDSTLELLLGDTGWVEHKENGILYCFDATKCMFSSGNISEKLRMAQMDCRGEVVVDLFAGIGYFVLPFLLKAGATLVYACEWNPNALAALRHNIAINCVEDRCIILEGDNCITTPKGVADRVCLGLLPSSEHSWSTAVRALRKYMVIRCECGRYTLEGLVIYRPEGGMLHVHGNVKDTEVAAWLENLCGSMKHFAFMEGYFWDIKIEHVERVKWYAPHILHLVADVRCKRT